MSNTIEEFRQIVKSPHNFARSWKERTGGKVLGYICTNLPEELLYAAGVLPVRLLGSNQPEDLTRPCMLRSAFCSFARDCFAQALQGRYDYIDGVTFAQCCPHAREIFLSWERRKSISYIQELMLPMYLQNRHAKKYLVSELQDYQRSLENWLGKAISSDDIDEAIVVYNTNRRMMSVLYSFMESADPPITEAEVAEAALAGMLMDKKAHNQLLEKLIQEITEAPPIKRAGPRLMLLGSVNSDIELIDFVDSLGGRVVIDDYCTGNRYYQKEVVPEENRLASLAARLIGKPPCPLKDIPERRRVAHLTKLADDYHVQGVVYTIQRLCDAHGLDYPAIDSAFKARGIPMLKLEIDYTAPVGQFRTRIEAFLEMIEASNT